MSYLVSDFLINPVLRQARRFSRSNTEVDPISNQVVQPHDGETIEDITAVVDSTNNGDGMEAVQTLPHETIAGIPLSSSPVAEDGDGGPENELAVTRRSSAVPVRLASLRSDSGHMDEDVSDNPSFGIPGRFRANSARSAASYSSSTNNTVDARTSTAEGLSRSRSSTLEQAIHQRSGSLPADDGMGPLRQQIVMIQALEVPAEQKARMMHRLLTQGYSHAQELYQAKNQPRPASPSSMISQERPATPGSLSSFIWQMNGSLEGESPSQQHIFRLSPEDLKRSYAPPDPPELDDDGVPTFHPKDEGREEVQVLGCPHYKRNVKLQCSTCDKWYTCRLCHDEAEKHILVRKETKYMLCMLCGSAQRAGEFCVECGERTAWYYCGVCKLWDNDSNKNIYHCHDCGICRKGRGLGKDFFHCKTCGTCMSMSVEHSHKCIERVSDCDCPICGDYMFTSLRPVVFMLCGHSIHQTCYYEHMKSSYKCPICSKSTVNMETQFQNLTRAIETQPMPPQFQDTKAMVSCNDCYAKSAVKYHWLGLKCAICDSYNTVQLSILSDPAVEVPTIETREAEAVPPEPMVGEVSVADLLGPTTGPVRRRRHSSHSLMPSGLSPRFSPYPQRIARSVSPVSGPGLLESTTRNGTAETEESDVEDDLDFWGRDGPGSVNLAENVVMAMEEVDESDDDSGSAMEECEEEDGDDDNDFNIFGHR